MNTIQNRPALAATLLLASLLPQVAAAPAARPELPTWQAETADAIARQGNEAVTQIRAQARLNAVLARPADLAEMASMATEVAGR